MQEDNIVHHIALSQRVVEVVALQRDLETRNMWWGHDSDFAGASDIGVKVLMIRQEREIAADFSPSLNRDGAVLHDPAMQQFVVRLSYGEVGLKG